MDATTKVWLMGYFIGMTNGIILALAWGHLIYQKRGEGAAASLQEAK